MIVFIKFKKMNIILDATPEAVAALIIGLVTALYIYAVYIKPKPPTSGGRADNAKPTPPSQGGGSSSL